MFYRINEDHAIEINDDKYGVMVVFLELTAGNWRRLNSERWASAEEAKDYYGI